MQMIIQVQMRDLIKCALNFAQYHHLVNALL